MAQNISDLLNQYVSRFPEETDPYITHGIVGTGDSLQSLYESIEAAIQGDSSEVSTGAVGRYRLRELKPLIRGLRETHRNTCAIQKKVSGEMVKGRMTAYKLDNGDHAILICRYELGASRSGSPPKIRDLKCTTVDNPKYFFITKLRSEGWKRLQTA